MKFSERMDAFWANCRTGLSSNCSQARLVVRFLLWHTCWCSLVVGGIILVVGIILRSKLIDSSNTQLVASSGLFFIIIGIFLIVLSPLIAVYELMNGKRPLGARSAPTGGTGAGDPNPESNEGHGRDSRADLPTYEEISKTPGLATYPRMLEVDSLSTNSNQTATAPGATLPPRYSEVVRTGSMLSKASHQTLEPSSPGATFTWARASVKSDTVATIAPSSQMETNARRYYHHWST